MDMREHGLRGKSEMWYVIKTYEDSHLFWGLNKAITPDEYRQRVKDGTITEVLADHNVKHGDVFAIPAGRVQTLCGGIMVTEIQQSSDLTYRIYDYNHPGRMGNLVRCIRSWLQRQWIFGCYPIIALNMKKRRIRL